MNKLEYKFNLINDWIKTADQKAMILGSFNIAGFVFQIIKFNNLICASDLLITLYVASLVFTVLALFFWLKVIFPRIDNKHHQSKIFFQHIANAYKHDRTEGARALRNEKDDEFENDLANQIIVNSDIAQKKYQDIQYFIYFFGLQLITLLVIICINLI